jgi:putative nucleotidyltransferase with HDIG domain
VKSKTTPFVIVIAAAATAVAAFLPSPQFGTASEERSAIVVLFALALLAELLAFALPKGASASTSSMPVLAAVLVSPSWETVAATAMVKAFVECFRRRELEKAVFNVAQYALIIGLAVLVYSQTGGTSLLNFRGQELSAVTLSIGAPAFAAFAAATAVNTLLVSAVIALATNAALSAVWRPTNLAKIGVDVIASPLNFLFAWAYVRFGPIAAAGFWAPIIGLRQVYKTNIELEQTNVELLDLMVKSIEARDPYTSGHSRRVQNYSMQIGRALSLAEKDIQMIGRAALLHDVGKIYEKYGPILRKADGLTPEEWTTMREHPSDGAELIATMTRLRELVAPVRHHHENWDGTGYPDGLAGELIPLAARIIRFADTIDAMTTARPYRAVMHAEDVRAEVVRCRGTQFDPEIVDKLLSSPIWKTMFPPAEPTTHRFELSVANRRVSGSARTSRL